MKTFHLHCVYKPGTGKFLLTIESDEQKLEDWLTPEQLKQTVADAKTARAGENTTFRFGTLNMSVTGDQRFWANIVAYLGKVYDGFASTHITDGAHKHNTKLPIKNGNS